MPRTVRGGPIETRTSRLKLAPRGRPYYAPTGKQGQHLGYRRLRDKNGTWIARSYQNESGLYKFKPFAEADDYADSDGGRILTFYEAMHAVAGEAPPAPKGDAQYSMRDAVADYLLNYEQRKKSSADARSRLNAYVVGHFGDRPLHSLAPPDFDAWLTWALAHKPSGRLKDGKQASKNKRPELPAAERERRRRASLNKVITYLIATLGHAHSRGKVASREAWAHLKKFKGTDSARIACLTQAEATRLKNACPTDFRQLVEVALTTGARYGELAALRARDFDHRSGTILVAESKSGKPRRVYLTDEGKALLESLTAGKEPDDLVLVKVDGTGWSKSEQFRRIRAACTAAKIVPAVNFHALRHTTASLLVEKGTPLMFVAQMLGHADTRMVERHYAHLAPSVVARIIRRKMPKFGIKTDTNVRKLRP